MTNYVLRRRRIHHQFNGRTLRRILARPDRIGVGAGFLVLIAIVSVLDAYFTFLSKRIIDEGIVAGNQPALDAAFIAQYGA